jgi:hypothetical protein
MPREYGMSCAIAMDERADTFYWIEVPRREITDV